MRHVDNVYVQQCLLHFLTAAVFSFVFNDNLYYMLHCIDLNLRTGNSSKPDLEKKKEAEMVF